MAIARKPKSVAQPQAERDIEALINKGGGVAGIASGKKGGTGSTSVILRLPPDLLEQVDAAVGNRSLRIPRHTWLLEAVLEKLDREQSR